jgi:hypothetical protein
VHDLLIHGRGERGGQYGVDVALDLPAERLSGGLVGAGQDDELVEPVDDAGLVDLVHGRLTEVALGDVAGSHPAILLDRARLRLPEQVDVRTTTS